MTDPKTEVTITQSFLNCLAWWAWKHGEISRGRCIELAHMPPEILRGWMIERGWEREVEE